MWNDLESGSEVIPVLLEPGIIFAHLVVCLRLWVAAMITFYVAVFGEDFLGCLGLRTTALIMGLAERRCDRFYRHRIIDDLTVLGDDHRVVLKCHVSLYNSGDLDLRWGGKAVGSLGTRCSAECLVPRTSTQIYLHLVAQQRLLCGVLLSSSLQWACWSVGLVHGYSVIIWQHLFQRLKLLHTWGIALIHLTGEGRHGHISSALLNKLI